MMELTRTLIQEPKLKAALMMVTPCGGGSSITATRTIMLHGGNILPRCAPGRRQAPGTLGVGF
ncbi:hypothetical protein VXQ18_07585 [Brucella abortus]|nr:hypothetical protein [Brucella abortus]